MDTSGQKKSDGIKRRKKVTRTRTVSRSFERDVSPEITSPRPVRLKKPARRSDGVRRKTTAREKQFRKIIRPEPTPAPDASLLEFKKNRFYTPPVRSNAGSAIIPEIFKWAQNHRKILGIIGRVVGVALLLFLFFNRTHTAQVSVQPHREFQTVSESLTMYKNPKESQVGFDIIALTDEESVSIIATDERPVEKFATGEITIFNDYSAEPQRLLPETRFQTAAGKVFKLGNNELIIPGKSGSTPGQITATVRAEKAGSLYNIDVSDFTVPGFKEAGLDAKYNGIYAVSKTAFTGGFIGTEPYISDDKRVVTESELQKKLRDRLLVKLQKEKTDTVTIINDTLDIRYKEATAIFDESKTSGVLSQRGTIFALVASQQDINEHVGSLMTEIVDEPVQVIEVRDLDISSQSDELINYEKVSKVSVKLAGEALVEWEPNIEIIGLDLRDKSTSDVKNYFENIESVDRAQVYVRPFWRGKLPSTESSIIVINTELD